MGGGHREGRGGESREREKTSSSHQPEDGGSRGDSSRQGGGREDGHIGRGMVAGAAQEERQRGRCKTAERALQDCREGD